MYLWTAFTIGLFGSLHCIGMCGPIALAVGGQRSNVWVNGLLYNLGRTVTYSLLGGIIGLLGQGLFFAGFQKSMTIAIGAALLLIAVFSINVETKLLKVNVFNRLFFNVKSGIGRWIQQQGFAGTFAVGVLNGLLPCGLVYMAVAGALSTGELLSGMAYMALFGLGTLPLMTVVSLAGNVVNLRFRIIFQKIYPAFLIFFAMLFLFRGLNFHIPGEFFFWEEMQDMPMCH